MITYKGMNKDMTCKDGFQYAPGEQIKADTWYMLVNGELQEVAE